MDKMTLTLHCEKDTQALAASLANQARIGDVIYLKGTLGMGKSTFARAFIRHLASNPHLEVPSPTFTLVQSYTEISLPVWHLDLYRLDAPEEIEELGLEEALSTAVTLIEWPERLGKVAFPNTLTLTLKAGETFEGREVLLWGSSSWMSRLKGVSL